MLDRGFRVITGLQKIKPALALVSELFFVMVMMKITVVDGALWHGVMSFVMALGFALVKYNQHRRGHSTGILSIPRDLCIPPSPRGGWLSWMVVLELWKGKIIVNGTEMIVVLNTYMSISSFAKHENKYAVGFVQMKSPAEQRGVQFHIICLVSIIFSLFWSPWARRPEVGL